MIVLSRTWAEFPKRSSGNRADRWLRYRLALVVLGPPRPGLRRLQGSLRCGCGAARPAGCQCRRGAARASATVRRLDPYELGRVLGGARPDTPLLQLPVRPFPLTSLPLLHVHSASVHTVPHAWSERLCVGLTRAALQQRDLSHRPLDLSRGRARPCGRYPLALGQPGQLPLRWAGGAEAGRAAQRALCGGGLPGRWQHPAVRASRTAAASLDPLTLLRPRHTACATDKSREQSKLTRTPWAEQQRQHGGEAQ